MRGDFRLLTGPMEDRELYHPVDEIEKKEKGYEGRGS